MKMKQKMNEIQTISWFFDKNTTKMFLFVHLFKERQQKNKTKQNKERQHMTNIK